MTRVKVVFRSGSEMVLDKPAGVSAEMRADPEGRSVLEQVRRGRIGAHWEQARLPHRLDLVTSGLLLVARDAEVVAHHNRHLERRDWIKHYVARVPGGIDLRGEHHGYLKRDGRIGRLVRSGGKPARLEVLAQCPDPDHDDAELVAIRLDTGRYHQIRVQLAAAGAPLVGDDRYDGPAGPMLLRAVGLAFVPFGEDELFGALVDDLDRLPAPLVRAVAG